MNLVQSRDFCIALGLDPSKTISIKIDADPGGFVVVETRTFLSSEQIEVLKRFALVEQKGARNA